LLDEGAGNPTAFHPEVTVSAPSRTASLLLCAVIVIALSNCSADSPTSASSARTFSLARVGQRQELLACPGGDNDVARATIGPEGGRLAIGGFVMDVPQGALLDTTTFVMKVPVAEVLEVRIRARGEKHFTFEKAVTITLDYSRCPVVPADPTAWYIEERSNAKLEQMPGFNDPAAQSFTLQTGHLSGYALAN
jgi:hypothetical protein